MVATSQILILQTDAVRALERRGLNVFMSDVRESRRTPDRIFSMLAPDGGLNPAGMPTAVVLPVSTYAEALVLEPDWADLEGIVDERLRLLIPKLAQRDLRLPEAGLEVGDMAWPVDLGWADERVAVVLEPDLERDFWLSQHNWQVIRTDMGGWDVEQAADALAAAMR